MSLTQELFEFAGQVGADSIGVVSAQAHEANVPNLQKPSLTAKGSKSLEEALEKANQSQWGLGSSIGTHNMKWANRAVREIDAGVTWINQIHFGYDELPFGGVKASGIGHEHGPETVDYYLEKKGAVFGGLDWE